jgi:hypothetical protein
MQAFFIAVTMGAAVGCAKGSGKRSEVTDPGYRSGVTDPGYNGFLWLASVRPGLPPAAVPHANANETDKFPLPLRAKKRYD